MTEESQKNKRKFREAGVLFLRGPGYIDKAYRDVCGYDDRDMEQLSLKDRTLSEYILYLKKTHNNNVWSRSLLIVTLPPATRIDRRRASMTRVVKFLARCALDPMRTSGLGCWAFCKEDVCGTSAVPGVRYKYYSRYGEEVQVISRKMLKLDKSGDMFASFKLGAHCALINGWALETNPAEKTVAEITFDITN